MPGAAENTVIRKSYYIQDENYKTFCNSCKHKQLYNPVAFKLSRKPQNIDYAYRYRCQTQYKIEHAQADVRSGAVFKAEPMGKNGKQMVHEQISEISDKQRLHPEFVVPVNHVKTKQEKCRLHGQ